MSTNSDLLDIIEAAVGQGWRHRRTNSNHHQLFSPNGKDIVTTGGTPSDHRAIDNFVAELKRAGFVRGLQTLGESLRPSTIEVKVNGSNGAKGTNGVNHPKLSATEYILDYMQRQGGEITTAELKNYVRSHRPDLETNSTVSATTYLCASKKIRRVGYGRFALVAKPELTLAPPVVVAPAPEAPLYAAPSAPAVPHLVAGARTGDARIDEDLAALDGALVALAQLDGVVRRNRDVLQQLANLKALLNK